MLPPMHEFVNVIEYARLRDSFNGGRTPSMDTSGTTTRTLSVNDFGQSSHSQMHSISGEYTFGNGSASNLI